MLIEAAYLTNPERLGWLLAADILEPPPPLDYSAWAKEHVRFGNESRFTGPYQPDKFPYNDFILKLLSPEHPSRVVVMKKSAQLGGTVLAQIFVAASLDLDPGPFLYVLPTDSNAERWSNLKWRPMLRQIESLKAQFKTGASREPGASTLYQERKDGRGALTISGANSEASLSMISMSRQVQDDLAKWETNRGGDPESQADSRSMAFLWAKIFKVSTPLIKDSCRITKAFDAGTQWHMHIRCPHAECSHEHPLLWENLEPYLDPERPDDAAFVCPSCGGLIGERERLPLVIDAGRTERWQMHRPGAEFESVYIWSAYSSLVTLPQIARRWFAAKGDPAAEQVFYNDWLGLAYSVAGSAPPWEGLRDRAAAAGHRRGTIPPGGLILSIGVDCQDDRVECHVVAFGASLRRAVVDYIIIPGHIGTEDCRRRLDALLVAAWPDSFGNRRPADILAIDGNAWTDDVWDWARRHPQSRVIMVRGIASDAAVPLARVKRETGKTGKKLKYSKRFYNMGASPMKSALYANLKKEDPLERGFVALPSGLGDTYFEQLCAEGRKPFKLRGGAQEFRWVLPAGKRNEALDTMLQAEAGAIHKGFRHFTDQQWDQLIAERETAPLQIQGDLEDLLTPGSVPTGVDHAAAPKETAASRRARMLQTMSEP